LSEIQKLILYYKKKNYILFMIKYNTILM